MLLQSHILRNPQNVPPSLTMLLITITPSLTLLLLHRLAPTSFPPTKTTSLIFILYTLSTQILNHSLRWHMLSPQSLYHLLKTITFLIILHILIFAIYTINRLTQCALRLKRAIGTMYAILAESTALDSIITHTSHLFKAPLKADPPPSTHLKTDHTTILTTDQTINDHTHASTLTNSILAKPPSKSSTLSADLYKDKEATNSTPSTNSRHQQASLFTAAAFTQRTRLCIQALVQILFYIPHFHRLILPHLEPTMSRYGQAARPLHFIRVCSNIIFSRMLNIIRRTSSYVVSHRDLYPPFLAVFVPHLLFWVILLSFGERYVLWMCVLTVVWLLSWLK